MKPAGYVLVIALAILVYPSLARAGDSDTALKQGSNAADQQAPCAPGSQNQIQDSNPAHVDVSTASGIKTSDWTRSGRPITVAIPGLKKWTCGKGHDYHLLRLVLAGHMLPKEEPTSVSLSQEYANFVLSPDTSDLQDRKSWFGILEEARRQKDQEKLPITVGLLNENQPFDSNQYITLQVYPWWTGWVVALLVVLLILMVWLGATTAAFRDFDKTSPFSLGRVQMAWWFYLVIAGYLYLWLVTGQISMLTPSVLTLIGISSATGLSAVFIDGQKRSTQVQQRLLLTTKQTALQNRIDDITKASPGLGSDLEKELQSKKSELTGVVAEIAALPPIPATPVGKGFGDILRDGDGISFSRFQIVVWTVVFGGVFVRAVLGSLTMPDFDATLLGLMGVSSGTYVGFKFPESAK